MEFSPYKGVIIIDCFQISILVHLMMAVLSMAGFYCSTLPTSLMNSLEENRLHTLEKRLKVMSYPNGTKYLTRILKPGARMDIAVHYLKMIETPGLRRYDFGATTENYCMLRPKRDNERIVSILRAMQLNVSVQALFRAVVLCSLTWRAFAVYFASRRDSVLAKRIQPIWNLTSWMMFTNEAVNSVSLLLVSCYSKQNDTGWSFLYPYLISTIIFTLVIKHTVPVITSRKLTYTTIWRQSIVIVCLFYHDQMKAHSIISAEYINCDPYATPNQLYPEWLLGISLLMSSIIDTLETKSLKIRIKTDSYY